jgi:hypothetical protein
MPQPDAARLTAVTTLFEVALREAQRVVQAVGEHGAGASTQPAMWAGGNEADSRRP